MKTLELLQHTDTVNELLARYGVKFGIYKNNTFKQLEEDGKLLHGHSILIIPCVNPYSMNTKKRFWSVDNTDINRMFPGYDLGETTQRIADGVFRVISEYKYGIQYTSFYMPGEFLPHVRLMATGIENLDLARQFGMPYVVRRAVRPFDTTTLNYNWQLWETHAFSMYTTTTTNIDKKSAKESVGCILNFLKRQGIVDYRGHDGYISRVVEDTDMVSVPTKSSGIFESVVCVGDEVEKGQLLARIIDCYEGEVVEELRAPADGIIFFMHGEPLTYSQTAVFKLILHEE